MSSNDLIYSQQTLEPSRQTHGTARPLLYSCVTVDGGDEGWRERGAQEGIRKQRRRGGARGEVEMEKVLAERSKKKRKRKGEVIRRREERWRQKGKRA